MSLGAPRSDSIRMRAGRAAEGDHALEELVDQLVRELADEVALPVVAVDAVAGVEDALLVEEALAAHRVVDQPRRRAKRAELLGFLVRAGVAGDDDQLRRKRLLRRAELRLELSSSPARASTSRKRAQRIADAVALVLEAPADDPLERMEPELGPRRHAEVATAAAQPPEELGARRRRWRGPPRPRG